MSERKSKRTEANAHAPCLVCEAKRGCSVGEDGLILCRGAKGERPGFKFLGKAKADPQWGQYRVDTAEPYRSPHQQGAATLRQVRPQAKQAENGNRPPWVMMAQQFAGELTGERRQSLSANLRLPAECLESVRYLGHYYTKQEGECWTFPECNGEEEVCGIVRRWPDGRKRMMRGGARGLTVTRDWEERPGAIYLPEGATCTLALAAMGLAAIGRPSNTGGVKELAKLLAGVPANRPIIVLGEWDAKPSGDWPGLTGCKSVAVQLAQALRRPIEWALPPDRAKDSRAWLNIHLHDWTLSQAALLLGQQFADLLTCERVQPEGKKEEGKGLVLRSLDKVESEVMDWLVPGYFPEGELCMISGDGGNGKSLLTVHMAAKVTRGEPVFNLEYDPPAPKHVLLMCCEDDTAKILRPRCLAANAVMNRVHEVQGIRDEKGKLLPFSLAHLDRLAMSLEENSDVGLVVIDPVSAYLAGTGVNPGRDDEVRTLLEPLRLIGRRFRVTILLVKHFNKSTSPKASARIADAAGWRNAVRACYLVFPDEEDRSKKLFMSDKLNGGVLPPSLIYTIGGPKMDINKRIMADVPADWPDEKRTNFCTQLATVEFIGETDMTADDWCAMQALTMMESPQETEKAAEWLRKFLADAPALVDTCVSSGNIDCMLNRPGKWWRDRILKGRLGGSSQKERKYQGQWYYCLPGQNVPDPE